MMTTAMMTGREVRLRLCYVHKAGRNGENFPRQIAQKKQYTSCTDDIVSRRGWIDVSSTLALPRSSILFFVAFPERCLAVCRSRQGGAPQNF